MLKSVEQFQILKGNAPFIVDVIPGDSCAVALDPVVDGNLVTVEVHYANQLCYEQFSKVTLLVTDSVGWKGEYEITMPDPCEDIPNPTIELLDRYKLIARMPAGNGPYTYKWKYNAQVLEGTLKDNTIDFEIIAPIEGEQVLDIEVFIENEAGCCRSATYALELCAPVIDKIELIAQCKPDESLLTPTFGIPVISACYNVECDGTVPINYNSLEIDPKQGFELINPSTGQYYFEISNTVPPGVYEFLASVEDFDGVKGYFTICINVPSCLIFGRESQGFNLFPMTGLLGCEDCDEVEAPVFKGPDILQPCRGAELIVPIQFAGRTPNYNTFTFIPGPGQTLVSATHLETENGYAKLNQNNEIVFTEDGNVVTEIIRYSLEGVASKLIIESEECIDEAPTLKDDSVCVIEGESVKIRPLDNDSGDIDASTFQFLGPYPAAGQGILSVGPGGVLTYTAQGASLPSKLVMQYTVSSTTGVQAPPAKIEINVSSADTAETTEISLCNPTEPLAYYGEENSYWIYTGPTATLTINGKRQVYKSGDKITHKTLLVTFETTGTYTFENHGSPCANLLQIVVVESLPAAEYNTYNLYYCGDDEGNYDLINELLIKHTYELPEGGTWRRKNTQRPYTQNINPSGINPGEYQYEYVIPRIGEYNQACEDIIQVNIWIDQPVYAGEDICIKLCSEGPLLDGEKDCRSNNEIVGDDAEPCVVCLMDKLEEYANPGVTITQGGKWILSDAPYTMGNVIKIGGEIYRLKIGEELPGGDNPCIDFGNMALPDWQFSYVVESANEACTDDSFIDVALFPPPCELVSPTEPIDLCLSETKITLYELMLTYIFPEPRECTPTEIGKWTVVGNNLNGYYLDQNYIGTDDYLVTAEVARGTYHVTYQWFPDNISTPDCSKQQCEEECETCSREVSFTINFDVGPDLGDPIKWAVCQNRGDEGAESCPHPLELSLNNPGPYAARRWYYRGFNNVNPNMPNPMHVGSIPDIVATKGSMWAIDEQVLAEHTTFPTDTDDSPLINFDNATVGFYFFRVEAENAEGCVSVEDIVIQAVEGPDSGSPGTCENICSNDPVCIDLECLIEGMHTPGGNWTFVGGSDCDGLPISSVPIASIPCSGANPAGVCDPCATEPPTGEGGFHAPSGTFNTTNVPCGLYVFGYEATIPPIAPGFTLSDCDACQPSVNEITIIIVDPETNAGEPGAPPNACS